MYIVAGILGIVGLIHLIVYLVSDELEQEIKNIDEQKK